MVAWLGEHGGDLLAAAALAVAEGPAVGERVAVGIAGGAGVERERRAGARRWSRS